MYILKKFLGEQFNRVNSIIDQQHNLLSGYINLIASSCYPYEEVVTAHAYPFLVFPIEGLADRRYFPGSLAIDNIEIYAEELTKKIFRLPERYRVTIQPHSNTQANQIVYNAILEPDDTVLSLKPSHGGHISHTILIGKRNPVVHYSLNSEGLIDYDKVDKLAQKHKPKIIIAGTSSYPREVDFARINQVAKKVNAFLLADIAHTALFIAAGVHKDIFEFADFATFTLEKNMKGPHGGFLIYPKKMHKKISYSIFPKTQGGPAQNVLFAKIIGLLKLLDMDIKKYALDVIDNARNIASILMQRGIPILTQGTDTHIVMADLRHSGITGLEAEKRFEQHRILLSRNLIPDDKNPPWIASGLRLGTSGVTNLDYLPGDIKKLAHVIADLLENPGNDEIVHTISQFIEKYHKNISTSSEAKE